MPVYRAEAEGEKREKRQKKREREKQETRLENLWNLAEHLNFNTFIDFGFSTFRTSSETRNFILRL